jgi:holo-[acyl-carrier protein] synthase
VNIIGIGVDCVDIQRFEKLGKRFLENVYTRREIEYCKSRKRQAQHFAGRFAAKEAILKASDKLGKRVAMNEIEILNKDTGSPDAKILKKEYSKYTIFLSISHSRSTATAFSILAEK